MTPKSPNASQPRYRIRGKRMDGWWSIEDTQASSPWACAHTSTRELADTIVDLLNNPPLKKPA